MARLALLGDLVRIAICLHPIKKKVFFPRWDKHSRPHDAVLFANIEKAHTLPYILQALCGQIAVLRACKLKIDSMPVSNSMCSSIIIRSKCVLQLLVELRCMQCGVARNRWFTPTALRGCIRLLVAGVCEDKIWPLHVA